MTAKKYLQQLYSLDIKIRQNQTEIALLREDATSISSVDYSHDRVTTSTSGEPSYIKTLDKISKLEAAVNKDIGKCAVIRNKIKTQIQEMDDGTSKDGANYSSLLFKRYIEFKQFEQIALELGYCYEHTVRMHGRALQAFAKRWLK